MLEVDLVGAIQHIEGCLQSSRAADAEAFAHCFCNSIPRVLLSLPLAEHLTGGACDGHMPVSFSAARTSRSTSCCRELDAGGVPVWGGSRTATSRTISVIDIADVSLSLVNHGESRIWPCCTHNLG
ncbi:MAG: hypothetical protein WEB50_15635 [Vicinamibacterales bacterium]